MQLLVAVYDLKKEALFRDGIFQKINTASQLNEVFMAILY